MMKKNIMFVGFISILVGITVTGLFFTSCAPAADNSTPTVFKLSFDANYGTGKGTGTMAPQTVAQGATITLPAQSFTRADYTFVGWSTTPDGEVEFADKAEYTMGTQDATLYAKWTQITHVLSFDANEGTGTMAPQTVAQGATITLPAQSFTRANYAFAGWSTTPDGEVAFADEAEYTMGTQDATLYAVWKPPITGTFNYQSLSTTYGQTQTSITPNWNGETTGQTVSYTISPPSDGSITGISINEDTGEVTIGTDAPVQSGTSYTVTATGKDNYAGILTGSISITVYPPANAAPVAPTIISTIAGPEEVSIIWEAPTDTGYINNDGTAGIITKYQVYYSTTADFDISVADGSRETSQTQTTISGLTEGTAYYFKVTAFNATDESPPSAQGNATPVNFSQDHTQQTVTLADSSTTDAWTLNSNSDFVHVVGGTFWMGAQKTDKNGQNYDEDADSYDSPVHQVTLSSFYISKYEVTQEQYYTVMGTYPSYSRENTNPVEQVSWYDAVAYCNQLSVDEGKEKVYTINGTDITADMSKNGYRLPTEAEWEYAARGGKNSKGYKYSGSNTAGDVAWHRDNSNRQVQQVGTKSPNELGLYDMNGNVREWCWDWFARYESAEQTDPTGPSTGPTRILRGGSWIDSAVNYRVTSHSGGGPDEIYRIFGFRVVLPPF